MVRAGKLMLLSIFGALIGWIIVPMMSQCCLNIFFITLVQSSTQIREAAHVGTILDLGRPGPEIQPQSEKNDSRRIPHGFHTVGVVFSTEMNST